MGTAGGAKGGARTKWPCSRSCDLCPANQRSQNQETNPIEPWDPGQGFREIRATSSHLGEGERVAEENHVSGVRCQVSGARCQVSGVRCQVSGVRYSA